MTKKMLCCVTVAKISFLLYNFQLEQINHTQTAVHGHPQLCRLPNGISFDVFA